MQDMILKSPIDDGMINAINALIFLRCVKSFTWREFVSFLISQWKNHGSILGESVLPTSLYTLKVIDNNFHLVFHHNPTSMKFIIPFRELKKISEDDSLKEYSDFLNKFRI